MTKSFTDVIKTPLFIDNYDIDQTIYVFYYIAPNFSSQPKLFSNATYTYETSGVYNVDAIPHEYLNTSFNYSDPVSINATIIQPSDTQPILTVGGAIYSPNGSYKLTLQTDGNLVLYKINGSTQTGLWSSRTQGHASASVYFQTDGNLVIYTSGSPIGTHSPIWNSGLYNHSGLNTVSNGTIYLQDDGNMVFYWPAYLGHNYNFNYKVIIFACTDTQGGIVAPHPGNLTHPLWQNNTNVSAGSGFNIAN